VSRIACFQAASPHRDASAADFVAREKYLPHLLQRNRCFPPFLP
jgi:hypothetical protein